MSRVHLQLSIDSNLRDRAVKELSNVSAFVEQKLREHFSLIPTQEIDELELLKMQTAINEKEREVSVLKTEAMRLDERIKAKARFKAEQESKRKEILWSPTVLATVRRLRDHPETIEIQTRIIRDQTKLELSTDDVKQLLTEYVDDFKQREALLLDVIKDLREQGDEAKVKEFETKLWKLRREFDGK